MNWFLLVMIIGAALTIYFTYDEYHKGKATKKHFTIILILDLIVIIIGLIMLFTNYST